ncbi:hypothetical protein KFE25_009147 [Diacronema lutheri]|uniref:Calcineurin-like phosphoesterase domain-containing protein n=2 Tax=Diacronema lutheri TaxID=2081491 RepID=A0A8J5XK41_DIALT|nr:hypothetical protein KFE25_009147 [Diacronema lutheri]
MAAVSVAWWAVAAASLRFRADGTFTVLQVADMHIANGPASACVDLSDAHRAHPCSDVNTTALLRRALRAVDADLVVFTGDNIFVDECTDVLTSLKRAFLPAIEAGVPWVATLGNHDEAAPAERRAALMRHVASLPGFAAALGPPSMHNGAGTFALHVGAQRSAAEPSGLTLFVLDSGGPVNGSFDCLHADQLRWLEDEAAAARERQRGQPPAAALAFFHIPLPQYAELLRARVPISGRNGQRVSCSVTDAGAFAAVERARDVKAVFVGHDHVSDFCGLWRGVQLCYAGGVGYHAYGEAGWPRRLRVIRARAHGRRVVSWKELDALPDGQFAREGLAPVDCELLWAAPGELGREADDCAGIPRARRHPPIERVLTFGPRRLPARHVASAGDIAEPSQASATALGHRH